MEKIPAYFNFFYTEDQAIDYCRRLNAGLAQPNYAVVDGPGGCLMDAHLNDCTCLDYAVVDLETARELMGDGPRYLIIA